MNIPVIFRNLRGYDNHFIMQEIGQIVKKKKLYSWKTDETQCYSKQYGKKYVAFMLSDHLVFPSQFPICVKQFGQACE